MNCLQRKPKSVVRFLFSLGCSLLWPIAEQRGEMIPVPATIRVIVALFFMFETSFDKIGSSNRECGI